MNYKEQVLAKLKKYSTEQIIITEHAKLQAAFRQVDLDEIRENILNPRRLVYAEKQVAKKDNEEKYDCYFGYSKTLCHRYIIVINQNCIVCTVIKINRRWQYKVEKNA